MKRKTAPLLILSLAVLAACNKQAGDGHFGMGNMPPPQVTVVKVEPQAVPVSFEYVGQTAGSKEVEVRGRVSGILEKRLFSEGSPVKAGQTLFQIDPKPLLAQAAAAEAEVASAEARLTQASREAARLKPLAAERAVSHKELDDAVSAEQVAVAGLKAAQARLQQIRLDLGYTRVNAPVSGITGRAQKSEGSLVTPGADSLLTTIVQVDPLYVSFSRSEAEQARIERELAANQLVLPNKRFEIVVTDEDGNTLARGGQLNFTATQVSNQTGTVENRAELPNPNGRLRAGQFVRVRLEGANRPNALTVPQRAVIEGPQGKMVMVAVAAEPGKPPVVQPRPVELGEWVSLPAEGPEGKAWIVRKGLAAGDQVIVDNLFKLRPGAPVTIASGAAPAAASAPAAAASAPAAATAASAPAAAR